MPRRFVYLTALIGVSVIIYLTMRKGSPPVQPLEVDAPLNATVFDRWEATLAFTGDLESFRSLPNIQVNDAYDADRNGQFIRMEIEFTHSSGYSMRVPSFAMKSGPDTPWQHKVRWSPDREGVWVATVFFEGSTGGDKTSFSQRLPKQINAYGKATVRGSIVPPGTGENPRYLRQKKSDGTSEPLLLYGTCRAWSLRQPAGNSDWGEDEMIDRNKELLTPMRAHGMDLLNKWMAPWEYLLVHHARAEHWEADDGTFKTVPISEKESWSSHQYYDQGRARAFDRLIEDCEGDEDTPTVRLFLAPLPHPLFRSINHPWSEGYAFWSPWENPDLPPNSINGFCTSEEMEAWDFFAANPRFPLSDGRSMRFDHQANFFRYLIARWGYSRAMGAWVILDEIEGIGDEEAYLPERTGFWAHNQCQRWLDDMVRLFNGRLQRAEDYLAYSGDPYNHPTSAATSSVRGDISRGANLDWVGGEEDATPDIQGWHWYPPISPPISNWWEAWNTTLYGVMSFNGAPGGDRPRLISEFGAADRQSPRFMPSFLYPSMYHFSAWASALSGHAGTVMDWNDGKQFGEFFPKQSKYFSEKSYPISPAKSLIPLQLFMNDLDLEKLSPINEPGALLTGRLAELGFIAGLTDDNGGRLYAWVFSPDTRYDTQLELRGLAPGAYSLTLYDTWSGTVTGVGELKVTSRDSTTVIDIQKWLYGLYQAEEFPYFTREYRGHDLAITILPRTGDN